MSGEVDIEGIKEELYGTVFTIRQKPCWFGDESPYTETLKLRVEGVDAFLVGRRMPMLCDAQPVRHKFKVPYGWAWELRDRLRRMKVTVYPDFAVGCDGGYTELSFSDCGCRACYKWWGEASYEWREMSAFTDRLIALFDAMCDMEGSSGGSMPELVQVCPVAGLSHVAGIERLLDGVETGERLELCREADNIYDPNAVAVMRKERIGYIPRKCNSAIASGMDAGQKFFGLVISHGGEYYKSPELDLAIFQLRP